MKMILPFYREGTKYLLTKTSLQGKIDITAKLILAADEADAVLTCKR